MMPRRLCAVLAAAALLLCLFAASPPTLDAARQKDLGPDRDKDRPKQKAERYESIWPDLKVGKTGYWCNAGSKSQPYQTKVVEVIDKDTMVMRLGNGPHFIVKGIPTKDLADDQVHELAGEWEVTRTRRHGGRTMHVVEPVPAKK